jgi:hypothetical protein
MNDAERAAFATHRVLRLLAALRDRGGWRFTHREQDGDVVLINGIRVWPHGWADALGVLAETDAQATRVNPDGELVWERTGDLTYVLEGLLELPAPNAPRAPHLVLRSTRRSAPELWIPRQNVNGHSR